MKVIRNVKYKDGMRKITIMQNICTLLAPFLYTYSHILM